MSATNNTPGHSLKIINGRLVLPGSDTLTEASLVIAGGVITALGAAADSANTDKVFDAAGSIVAPGLVDLCCNLR
ncbi:MAG TPA: hypothetical protein VLN90_07140, partial [Thioalkalivibrio sp.]|nr:hypothetical protein [Thioalkalivibrio sp.]